MTETSRPVVVVPGDDPPQIADSPHLDRIRERAELVVYDTRPADEAEQIARVRDANVIMNSRGQVRWFGGVFDQLPKLKMITTCAIGTDSIDLETAESHGVTVCNIPGRTAPVVAEHAFALMLATARRMAYFTSEMKRGEWPRLLATSLTGKTLGVVGTGNIGCEMIRLSKAFGMNVNAWSFHPSDDKARQFGFDYVELDDLLKSSDVVSIHVKLTDDSRKLIGQRELSLMKPGSLLINTARGPVVDTTALIDCLNAGHLAGAGLDVFDTEPLPEDDPIAKCEHIVLTPHCADQTPEGVDLLNSGCVENVIAFLDSKPQNVVV